MGNRLKRGWAFVLIAVVVIGLVAGGTLWVTHQRASTTPCAKNSLFIVRCGIQLFDQGKPFRFAGPNIYWLGLDGDGTYPSAFRVDNALAMAEEMGATVVRTHTLGISVGCPNCIEPTLDQFNDAAFAQIDQVLVAAKRHHLRLIIPLVDNWRYYHGGKHTFAEWRGFPGQSKFYSDQNVVNDFKRYIQTILIHVNALTGVAYKDDPTIMTWETGNELDPPIDWTKGITHFIKGLDGHHLIMDGRYGIDQNLLNSPDIDMYSNHFYPMRVSVMQSDAAQVHQAGKVYLVGEFAWPNQVEGDTLPTFLDAVRQSTAVGDLFWDMFAYGDTQGYSIPAGDNLSLVYPGTNTTMRQAAQLLRNHAYAMRGTSVPLNSTPDAPFITAMSGKTITWRGTLPAASYTIERSTISENGPWITACTNCATMDATTWVDDGQPSGVIWYHVRGVNLDGVAGPFSPSMASSK